MVTLFVYWQNVCVNETAGEHSTKCIWSWKRICWIAICVARQPSFINPQLAIGIVKSTYKKTQRLCKATCSCVHEEWRSRRSILPKQGGSRTFWRCLPLLVCGHTASCWRMFYNGSRVRLFWRTGAEVERHPLPYKKGDPLRRCSAVARNEYRIIFCQTGETGPINVECVTVTGADFLLEQVHFYWTFDKQKSPRWWGKKTTVIVAWVGPYSVNIRLWLGSFAQVKYFRAANYSQVSTLWRISHRTSITGGRAYCDGKSSEQPMCFSYGLLPNVSDSGISVLTHCETNRQYRNQLTKPTKLDSIWYLFYGNVFTNWRLAWR